MRARWLALLLLAAPHAALANSFCLEPSSRDLLSGAQFVAIVRAASTDVLTIVAVRYGNPGRRAALKVSEHVLIHTCGVELTPRAEYLAVEACGKLALRPLDRAQRDLVFLENRHFVRWTEVVRMLRDWQEGTLPTARFHHWIASADTDEPDDDAPARRLIEILEWTTGDLVKAPEKAEDVRNGPIAMLIRSLAAMPAECQPYDLVNELLSVMYDSPEFRAKMPNP
ncbi:MAG TPA: hypothetical protein VJZ76_14240 [Thermoanaerobaculia bacterium]|nr:hypothetical protein [Thermoanaerobaculia bacterium]